MCVQACVYACVFACERVSQRGIKGLRSISDLYQIGFFLQESPPSPMSRARARSTMGQNRKKNRINNHPIIHCPMSERCERTSEWTSEWPSTYVWVFGRSGPLCVPRSSFLFSLFLFPSFFVSFFLSFCLSSFISFLLQNPALVPRSSFLLSFFLSFLPVFIFVFSSFLPSFL